MIQGNNGMRWRRSVPRLALAAIVPLLLAIVAACSGAAPTPATTTFAPPPTATPAATVAPTEPTSITPTSPPPASTPPPPTGAAATEPTSTTATSPPPASTPPPPTAAAATEPPAAVKDADKLAAISAASDEVYALLEELIAELGPRASGSEEELIAAEYLRQWYHNMGYLTKIQPFTVVRFDFRKWAETGGENANVAVESPTSMKFAGLPLTPSPSDASISAPLTTLDLSQSDELPVDGLQGRVVHVRFGDLKLDDFQVMMGFFEQVDRLADAGAVAVVFSRKLGDPTPYQAIDGIESPIPALFITGDDGKKLEELPATDEEIVVSVNIEVDELESRNVIAEKRGIGDDVVVVGAHYDTIPEGSVGANDNASGTAVILALAEALSAQSLPFTIRFVSFGSEEVGLLGSRHYVASLSDTELEPIKAMLNFDVVGSGAYTAVSGNRELTNAASKLAADLQVQAQQGALPRGATSDHAPFETAGVPVLFIWAPDISRINSPGDTLEFVDPQRLGETFLLAEALLTSPEFPPR